MIRVPIGTLIRKEVTMSCEKQNTKNFIDEDEKAVRLINGKYCVVKKKKIAGYCNNVMHRGYLTESLYKLHKCKERQCKNFSKCRDALYWAEVEKKEKIKKEYKRQKKLAQQEKKKNELSAAAKLEEIKLRTQSFADTLKNPLKFVSVHMTNNNRINLYYVSDIPTNDWYEYRDLAFLIGELYNTQVYIIHIRAPDKHYVTTEEYNKNYYKYALKQW